ncbi:unnamed protein product [Effrenium voratum]|nr:unnamed protein product [Effrenium voratum]
MRLIQVLVLGWAMLIAAEECEVKGASLIQDRTASKRQPLPPPDQGGPDSPLFVSETETTTTEHAASTAASTTGGPTPGTLSTTAFTTTTASTTTSSKEKSSCSALSPFLALSAARDVVAQTPCLHNFLQQPNSRPWSTWRS